MAAAATAETRLRDVSARRAGRERRPAATRRACAPSRGGTDLAPGSWYRAAGAGRVREVTWVPSPARPRGAEREAAGG